MTAQQYYEKGEALFTEEKYEEAKEQYLKATKLAPDWAESIYSLGVCHYWFPFRRGFRLTRHNPLRYHIG